MRTEPAKHRRLERAPAANRPRGITALSVFFAAGFLIALTSAVSLLLPESFLEPMWQLNPRARTAFSGMGMWAPALLGVVSVACAAASLGLWRGRRWGYRIGTGLLIVNLIGDVANVALGTEPRAIVGIPIVALLLFYLSRPGVRACFE
ncbi:MAG: hypothetical protein ACJ759_23955 [Thermoanaerobaculia bacterium]